MNLLFFLLLLFAVWIIFRKSTEAFTNPGTSFPRILWTFWDSEDLPPSVQTCIATWKKHNPNYEIRVLNKKNLKDYLDEDLTRYDKFNDMVQRFADLVRISILEKHGGIWSDATIICNKPYTWIEEAFRTKGCEFVGYYIDKFTKPEMKPHAHVIENWFFAAVPGSQFIRDWRREFLRFNTFPSAKQYIEDVEKTTDLQNIHGKEYLAMHCAAQKALQKKPNGYALYLQKAEDGPFKYLEDAKWDSYAAVKKLVDSDKYAHLPLIKLRGGERKVLESILKDNK